MPTNPVDENNIEVTSTPAKTTWREKSLGDGLILKLKNDEKYSYLARICVQGKDEKIPIGKVSRMSEDEARRAAIDICNEINKIKHTKKLAETKVRAKAAKPTKEVTPCFKNYNDAIQFIDALENKVINISSPPYDSPPQDNSIKMDEAYAMIWLALLTPLNIDELLQERFEYIYGGLGTGIYLTILGKSDKFYLPLSSMATQTINKLKSRHSSGNQKIFPRLSALDKKDELDEIIKQAIDAIWTIHSINPNELVQFFKHIANRYSCFKPEFIESFTKKQLGHDQWKVFPHEQRRLSDWWSECIRNRQFGFKSFKFEHHQPHSGYPMISK